MHHPITVLRQACKAEAAAAQPLPQPQPQPLSQPQPKSQLQQQADAQARAAAQHAKAKQAQAEYRRLQHHFVQQQQHGRIKGPPWQCPGSVPAPGHMPSALGNSTLSGGRNSVQLHGLQATADLKVADPTLFWPSREQEQQLLQAQLAAATMQQEAQQRLQQARKAMVSTATN